MLPKLGKSHVALQELSSRETRVPEGQMCGEEGLWTHIRQDKPFPKQR